METELTSVKLDNSFFCSHRLTEVVQYHRRILRVHSED